MTKRMVRVILRWHHTKVLAPWGYNARLAVELDGEEVMASSNPEQPRLTAQLIARAIGQKSLPELNVWTGTNKVVFDE
jgi:hypothetical protein